MFFVRDPEGIFVDVDPRLPDHLGWSIDEFRRRPSWDFVHPEDRDRIRQGAMDRWATGRPAGEIECRCLCADGSHRWFVWWTAPRRDLGLVFNLGMDITERKNREEELLAERRRTEEAIQAVGQQLAVLCHELRTPIHAIIGFRELLTQTSDAALRTDYLDHIGEAADDLLHLVNSVIDLSRIEAGKTRIEVERFDLRREIQRVVGVLSARAIKKNIALEYAVDADVPPLLVGDRGKLHQVLVNLIANAVNFTDAGRVRIEARRVHRQADRRPLVQINVLDTGCGIPDHDHARIFGRYEQADGTAGARLSGSGLGLAIAKSLVELMGGTIWVRSARGQGSRFSFALPLGETDTDTGRDRPVPATGA